MSMAGIIALRLQTNRSMHITRGYSRDHRPDLNQVMLELVVEHQKLVFPVLMKPLSGHSNDSKRLARSSATTHCAAPHHLQPIS